jgi:aminopeptidase N
MWSVTPLLVLCWGALPRPVAPDFRVFAYQLDLRIDREHRTVSGRETLYLRSNGDGLATVVLPLNGIEVRSVVSDRGAALATHTRSNQIEISFAQPLRRGEERTLVVDYSAKEPKGLVFQADAVYTVFHTCHWMLCRDRPDDKATFTLDLAVPDGLTLVASGAPTSNGARAVWTESVPSSPYLFGFALGRLSRIARVHAGVTFEYFVRPGDEAWAARVFADDDRMLDFFVSKAGRALPRPFYRQVVVAGEAAQELSSFSILGRDLLDRRLADATEDWLVAHELAHQFWGNLVTCADWSHFWLNEGLTVFLVAAYKETRWGAAAYQHELGLLRNRHRAAVEAGFDVPLTFAGEYPSLKIKRAITYSKAALFLVQLRETMGERAFWSALAGYTRRFAGRTATTRDFQGVFAAESDRDLSALFAKWAY